MKKWFEYQLENCSDRSRWAESYRPVTNVYDELATDFEEVKRFFSTSMASPGNAITKGKRVMAYESHIRMIETTYTDTLVQQNIRAWAEDPEFSLLCNQPSFDLADLNIHMQKFSQRLCQIMHVYNADSSVFLQVQQPGYISGLHIDARKHLAGTERATADGRSFNNGENADHDRWFIFLEDWIMGQVLQLGTEFVKWRAGDVYYWNVRDVPHALGNLGYHPRYLIVLKARKTPAYAQHFGTVDQ